MTYKNVYEELARAVKSGGVILLDLAPVGWCFHINNTTNEKRLIIYVDGKLSWKRRAYTIAHEIGHVFTFNKEYVKQNRSYSYNLNTRKRYANEQVANKTAVAILRELLRSKFFINDYKKFYTNQHRKIKRWSDKKKYDDVIDLLGEIDE